MRFVSFIGLFGAGTQPRWDAMAGTGCTHPSSCPSWSPPPPVPGDLSWWVALTCTPLAPQGLSSPGGPGPCLRVMVTPWVLCTSRGGTGWCEGLGSSVFRQRTWAWSWAPWQRMFMHGCTCISLTSGTEATLVMFLCSSGSVGPFGLRALCSVCSSRPFPASLPTHLGCGCPAPLGASGAMAQEDAAQGCGSFSAVPLLFLSLQPPEIPI